MITIRLLTGWKGISINCRNRLKCLRNSSRTKTEEPLKRQLKKLQLKNLYKCGSRCQNTSKALKEQQRKSYKYKRKSRSKSKSPALHKSSKNPCISKSRNPYTQTNQSTSTNQSTWTTQSKRSFKNKSKSPCPIRCHSRSPSTSTVPSSTRNG